jgi:hypothetical protein
VKRLTAPALPGAALLAEPIRQHPANPRYFLFRATTSAPSPAME